MEWPSERLLCRIRSSLLMNYCSFTPSIVQGLGFTAERAQLMSVPPFVVAFFGEIFDSRDIFIQLKPSSIIVTMLGSYISDRLRCRGLVCISSAILSIIGFGMFLGKPKYYSPPQLSEYRLL